MTIDAASSWGGVVAYYARCSACLFVSEPYGDETAASILGAVHRCD